MKTSRLIRTVHFASLVICASFIATPLSYAGQGANTGGGGDAATEMRIDEIRADVLKWISEGGAAGLRLPSGIGLDDYRTRMLKILQPHSVVIGGITATEERMATDPELKVEVNGQPKTCRGFVSERDHLPHILCKSGRFAATLPAEQYRLVHHEYAGMVGIEQNIEASSDYQVSQQITDFLVPETVLRLAVRKPHPEPLPVKCNGKCTPEDFVGSYQLSSALTNDCKATQKFGLKDAQGESTFDLNGEEFTLDHHQSWDSGTNCYMVADVGCTTQKNASTVKADNRGIYFITKGSSVAWWFGAVPVPVSVFGSLDSWTKVALYPTDDNLGALHYVVWEQNIRTGKKYIAQNCRYDRVGR